MRSLIATASIFLLVLLFFVQHSVAYTNIISTTCTLTTTVINQTKEGIPRLTICIDDLGTDSPSTAFIGIYLYDDVSWNLQSWVVITDYLPWAPKCYTTRIADPVNPGRYSVIVAALVFDMDGGETIVVCDAGHVRIVGEPGWYWIMSMVAGVYGRVSRVEGLVSSGFSSVEDRLARLESLVGGVEDRLGYLTSVLSRVSEGVARVEKGVDAVLARLGDVSSLLSIISVRLEAVSEGVEGLSKSLDSSLARLESRVAGVESLVENLAVNETRVYNALAERLESLESRVAGVEAAVAERMDSLESLVENLADGLRERLRAIKTLIERAGNETIEAAASTAWRVGNKTLEQLTTRITATAAAATRMIEELNATIERLSERIEARVAGVATRLNDLESNLSSVKEGIAAEMSKKVDDATERIEERLDEVSGAVKILGYLVAASLATSAFTLVAVFKRR